MSYVPARAVPADEDPAHINMGREPWIGSFMGLGDGPVKHGPRVVVRRREGVFRGPPVIDGHDEDFGVGGELVEVVVVDGAGGGADAEAAAVEVDEEGELARRAVRVGEVKPSGDAGVLGDEGVSRGDSGGLIERRGDEVCAGEPFDGAVVVDEEEWGEVLYDELVRTN
ncbi:hypothetical protein QJS10_CPA01g00211 [Acorus calamus]|uniref:Uncharacterized protein n=1 Tax=Acorus calamus TaxID=4465 RepID=A0AAV9FHI2_ACOCL|nr:hypothetical protein QJS10_CPA01g00211 [Acorus calamus]